MRLELLCPSCDHQFVMPADSPAAEVLDQMLYEGPWAALGDGETLEDKVSTELDRRATPSCPRCGELVPIDEGHLSEFARELLAHW